MLFVLVSNNEALTAPAPHRGETTKSVCCLEGSGKKGRKLEEKKGTGNKEDQPKKGEEEEEMINPIKPLSLSSIGIVLRWLPLPRSTVGCS